MSRQKLPGVGVVVGRFQVHRLHEGHRLVLDRANCHQKMLVFIGIHPALVTPENPLDFPTRQAMIRESYPDATIIPLPDQPTDAFWSQQLDGRIREYSPIGSVTIYCGRDGFQPHYLGAYRVLETEDTLVTSGTEIRKSIGERVLASEDFRAGVCYAAFNQRSRVYPTVDIAMTRWIGETLEVLTITKRSGRHFPGGFIDPSDESAEMAAARELQEETGLTPAEGVRGMHFICSRRIKDWRDTANDRILTVFFHCAYSFGMARANDDADTVEWLSLNEWLSKRDDWGGDHAKLASALFQQSLLRRLV